MNCSNQTAVMESDQQAVLPAQPGELFSQGAEAVRHCSVQSFGTGHAVEAFRGRFCCLVSALAMKRRSIPAGEVTPSLALAPRSASSIGCTWAAPL